MNANDFSWFMQIPTELHHYIHEKFTHQAHERFRLLNTYCRDLSELNHRRQFCLEATECVADRDVSEAFRCRFRPKYDGDNLVGIPLAPIPNLLWISSPIMLVKGDMDDEKCRRILEVVETNPIRADRLEFEWAVLCEPQLLQELIQAIHCRHLHFGEIPISFTDDQDEMDMRFFDLDVVRNMSKVVVDERLALTHAQFLAMRCLHMEFAWCPRISSDAIIGLIEEWKENRREITFCKVTLPGDTEDDDDLDHLRLLSVSSCARLGLIGEEGKFHLERNEGDRLHLSVERLRSNWRIKIFTEETKEELVDDDDDSLSDEDASDKESVNIDEDQFPQFTDDSDTDHDSYDCEDENCHICIERKYPESDDNSDEGDDDSEEESDEDGEESGDEASQ